MYLTTFNSQIETPFVAIVQWIAVTSAGQIPLIQSHRDTVVFPLNSKTMIKALVFPL